MYEEYFDKLKKAFQIRNRKESSLEAYKQSISKFLDTIGKNPEEVTLEDARDYIFDLRVNQKKSTQYCNSINSALKFFYRFVLNKPWDEDVVPRMINDLKQPEVMPLESIEKVIDTATAVRNKAIIIILGITFILCSAIWFLWVRNIAMGIVWLAIGILELCIAAILYWRSKKNQNIA